MSDYYNSLEIDAKQRYDEKLRVGGVRIDDPYNIQSGWELNISLWPAINYGYIWMYLIDSPGEYTRETLKAYKSLEAYNYFISNKVQEVSYHNISKESDVCILKANVQPGQRTTVPPNKAWVCVNKEVGYIQTAHCTCMAGLGEVCSHVAAILFKVEAAVRLGLNKESCTDIACTWNKTYTTKVTPSPLDEIDFSKPVHGKRRKKLLKKQTKETDVPKPVLAESLTRLRQICPSAGILMRSESDTDSAPEGEESSSSLPPMLSSLYSDSYCSWTQQQLAGEVEKTIATYTVTSDQSKALEEATRDQATSNVWKLHRKGRVTASIAHRVFTLKESTNPARIVEGLFSLSDDLSSIPAIQWGRQNEETARDVYKESHKSHTGFKCRKSGLVVPMDKPFIGASPDGVVICECHGHRLLEIKCPFKHMDKRPWEIKDPDFCLDDNGSLKHSHQYYTQIQFQMYVCKYPSCDFVVWTPYGITFTNVAYDEDFCKALVSKVDSFIKECVIPELLAGEEKTILECFTTGMAGSVPVIHVVKFSEIVFSWSGNGHFSRPLQKPVLAGIIMKGLICE